MANQIKLTYGNGADGFVESENYKTDVSYRGNGLAPYELFLGGYAACLHATFMGIMRKRKLDFEEITYDVVGHKREEVPTILNKLITNVVITGANPAKQKQIIKSMEQAETYCSISDTIKRLGAEMILDITFE